MSRAASLLWTFCLLALVPATSFAQGCQPALGQPPLAQAGELSAAINPTVAPIQYIDENGKLVGLDVDLGNAIASRLCLKMNFISTQFATMIPSLKDGRFDMIDTFMYYTPERASQVLMVPYGAATLAILVPSANKDAISDLSYFSGKTFAVQLGSVDEKNARDFSDSLVKDGKKPIDVRSFPNYSDVLQTLSAGQVDGAFVGTEQAYYYQKKNVTFFRVAAAGLYPHTEALAFKSQEVADKVVAVMNAMRADGSFEKLFAPYHHCTLPPPYKVTTGPIPAPTCPAHPE
jgi:polar amino acid transport system substrate-binding protein